jgi:hypothetical protein
MRYVGRFGGVAALALWLLLGPVAAADEPPPEDAPKPPVAEEKADPPPAWSQPPEAAPALPPPTVIVRRRGTPLPPVHEESAVKDVPSEIPPPTPAAQPEREVAPPTAPAPPPEPERRAEDGRLPIAMTPSMVQSITKTHNVPLEDGERVLKLEVEYEVVGQAGRDVYVGIWFVRKDKDRYVRAAMWQYRDPQGYLTAQTRSARVGSDTARYVAALQVPYGAFPMREGDQEYEVQGRVLVLRRESGSRMTVLARGETTFTVYAGPAEPEAVEPPAEAAPEAFPAPTGTIEEPWIPEGEGPKAEPAPDGIIEDVKGP